MKSKFLVTLLLTFGFLLAACAPAPTATQVVSTPVIPVTGDTATPEVTTAPTEAMTATEAPTTAATQAPITGLGTATAVTLKVDNSGAAPHLVDDQGRAVYLYTKDAQGATTSACTDTECTSEWTAVLVTSTPTAGDGVNATLLGTITRNDGQMQATYNGHPLYYFNDDTNPGDTKGQGMESEWFLVSPTGDAVQS